MTNETNTPDDNINVGDISGSTGVAIGRGATAKVDIHNYSPSTASGKKESGDTYNFSGNFPGAILNVNATLKNVQQTIGALPTANDQAKAELEQLVSQLQDSLQKVPAEKGEDAKAVAEQAKTLVEMANKEKPNKQLLQVTGEELKQAAKNLAAIVPDVAKIAGAIVKAVLAL